MVELIDAPYAPSSLAQWEGLTPPTKKIGHPPTPTRSATWEGGYPHVCGQRGRGVGDHPPSPDLGCLLFLHRKCRFVRVEIPTEGFCLRSFFVCGRGPDRAKGGEGVPPTCPDTRVGGCPPAKRTRGEGGDPPSSPILFFKTVRAG